MALPHARRIGVSGEAYSWIASSNGRASDYGRNTLRLFVEHAETPGSRLRVVFAPADAGFAWGFDPWIVAVTPGLVRAAITHALAHGWVPTEKGPEFIIDHAERLFPTAISRVEV